MLIRRCSVCDAVNSRQSHFCSSCGAHIEFPSTPTRKPDSQYEVFERRVAKGFTSPETVRNVSIGLVVLSLVFGLIAIVSDAMEINLINQVISGEFVSDAALDANDQRQVTVYWLSLGTYFLAIAAFMFFIHRVASNLPEVNHLDRWSQKFSPGWSVGWFFIPFANFVQAPRVVAELWKGSHPSYGLRNQRSWTECPVTKVIWLWWALVVISGIMNWSLRSIDDDSTLEDYVSAIEAVIVAEVLFLLAGIAVIWLIKTIAANQIMKFSAMAEVDERVRESEMDDWLDP
jgi:hypothetical protein